MPELWHAAGRAAGDAGKRRLALLGVLWSAPVLVAGSAVSHLLTNPGSAFEGLDLPLAYVLEPLRNAYESDHDIALFGYLAWQGLLMTLLWGLFGGALHRMAAVDLTQGRRDDMQAALRFARRHWRGLVGSKAALFVGTTLPLAVAILVAGAGRIDGALGGLLFAVAIVVAVLLAFFAIFLAGCWLVAGFLTSPVIAAEDSDAFDALSRTFGYAGAGLPRLTLWRLAFFGGVLLGALWRLARTVVVVLVAYACLRLGAGAEAVENIERILGARGEPQGAERLGLVWSDYAAAFAFALAMFLLAAFWCADLIARVVCARCAVYLALREAVDAVPRAQLATAPEAPAFQDAEAAGFEEVVRVGSK